MVGIPSTRDKVEVAMFYVSCGLPRKEEEGLAEHPLTPVVVVRAEPTCIFSADESLH